MSGDMLDVWISHDNLEGRELGVLSKAFIYQGGRSWSVIHPRSHKVQALNFEVNLE